VLGALPRARSLPIHFVSKGADWKAVRGPYVGCSGPRVDRCAAAAEGIRRTLIPSCVHSDPNVNSLSDGSWQTQINTLIRGSNDKDPPLGNIADLESLLEIEVLCVPRKEPHQKQGTPHQRYYKEKKRQVPTQEGA